MQGGWPLFLLGILLTGTPLYAAEDQPQVVRVFKVFNGASLSVAPVIAVSDSGSTGWRRLPPYTRRDLPPSTFWRR